MTVIHLAFPDGTRIPIKDPAAADLETNGRYVEKDDPRPPDFERIGVGLINTLADLRHLTSRHGVAVIGMMPEREVTGEISANIIYQDIETKAVGVCTVPLDLRVTDSLWEAIRVCVGQVREML